MLGTAATALGQTKGVKGQLLKGRAETGSGFIDPRAGYGGRTWGIRERPHGGELTLAPIAQVVRFSGPLIASLPEHLQ
ncbi:MAG TPA: hypothetical protein PKI05_09310 [Thermogutta sp.]|nr:hypothetical protein [Thermogutta sp.]HOP77916.1 hypothetical protein [Thermogutta sp.]HPZ82536.1 hypothetical protein [Thermogutta sp.]